MTGQIRLIGHKGYAALDRRIFPHLLPVDQDGAFIGLINAAERPQKCGFAGAVRADHPVDTSVVYRAVYIA